MKDKGTPRVVRRLRLPGGLVLGMLLPAGADFEGGFTTAAKTIFSYLSTMAARDKYHDIVRVALEKDGWDITHDPYAIEYGGTEYQVDLGAEKMIAAERDGKKIAV